MVWGRLGKVRERGGNGLVNFIPDEYFHCYIVVQAFSLMKVYLTNPICKYMFSKPCLSLIYCKKVICKKFLLAYIWVKDFSSFITVVCFSLNANFCYLPSNLFMIWILFQLRYPSIIEHQNKSKLTMRRIKLRLKYNLV